MSNTTPKMPTSQPEWEAHWAFYRLTLAQRDGAWREIQQMQDLRPSEEVEGYVWCDKEGEVHDDTLNPYGYNEAIAGQDLCKPEHHRKLYMEKITPYYVKDQT